MVALFVFVLPAAARAAGSVYVANSGGPTPPFGNVSQYAIGAGGGLSPLFPASVTAGATPEHVAVTPDGKNVYVTNAASLGSASQYDVDPSTGGLSPKNPPSVVTGAEPQGIAVTPDGSSVYIANRQGGTISQYDVDRSTGGLSPKTPPTVASGLEPVDIAVTPDGKSAYVTIANFFQGSLVLQYNIDSSTGALSPKSPPTVVAGREALGVTVTPDGRSAYVTNEVDNTVSQYTIDTANGTLSPKTPAMVATGSSPLYIAVTPDGRSAYVTNSLSASLSQYDIAPLTGALSPKTPPAVVAGQGPFGVAVSPDGNSAYVTDAIIPGTVSQYDIARSTGTLSSKAPATVAAGPFPGGIAVGPLPAPPKHSTAASLTCSPSIVVAARRRHHQLGVRRSTTCTATVSDTASSEPTPPTGAVVFAASGPGSFRGGASCGLAPSTSSAAGCYVTYRPQATPPKVLRTDTIGVIYTGDPTHVVSAATTTVKVVSIP